MDQGLRRSIALPVVGRVRAHGRQVPREIWASENWRHVGSCRDSDPNVFYPLGRGRPARELTEVAKSICRACPSRRPCLAFALATRQDLGVWGGTSPEERRELLRARRRAVAS